MPEVREFRPRIQFAVGNVGIGVGLFAAIVILVQRIDRPWFAAIGIRGIRACQRAADAQANFLALLLVNADDIQALQQFA